MTAISDRVNESTIAQARAGDPAAFEAIMQQYQGQIYSFIYRMVGDPDDAHDLTQDTFLKAFRALGNIDGELNLSAWLHRIASNAALDVLRRRMRLRWLPWEGMKHDHLLLCAPIDEPEAAAESQETRVVVQQVLNRMSHRHRTSLVLREYEGLSCQEIGDAMGLSRSAVKSMLFRARDEFRDKWAAAADTERQEGAA